MVRVFPGIGHVEPIMFDCIDVFVPGENLLPKPCVYFLPIPVTIWPDPSESTDLFWSIGLEIPSEFGCKSGHGRSSRLNYVGILKMVLGPQVFDGLVNECLELHQII
jgi:hypothetical protein